MNKNYLVKTFLNLYNNEGSYYRRPETKISEANRKTLKVETSAGSISGSEQAPVSNVIEPKTEVKGDTATAKKVAMLNPIYSTSYFFRFIKRDIQLNA